MTTTKADFQARCGINGGELDRLLTADNIPLDLEDYSHYKNRLDVLAAPFEGIYRGAEEIMYSIEKIRRLAPVLFNEEIFILIDFPAISERAKNEAIEQWLAELEAQRS